MQRISVYLGLLCLFLSSAVWSQDRLVMKNGDIITGNISKIAKDEIFIEPPYVDEFAVSVSDVVSMETEETFEMALTDGRDVDARFALDGLGNQVLVVEGESSPIAMALDQIWEANEPEDYYTRDSRVDFSVTNNSGNTNSNTSLLYADTRVRVGDHRHNIDVTFRREDVDGEATKEQDLLNYSYGWTFNDPWYLGGQFTYERDPIRELDYRYVVGANIGRDIFDDSVKFMTFSFGGGYSEEEIGGIRESGAVGLWTFTYNHDFFSGDVTFHHTDNLTQQFYGNNNSIFKSTTGLRTELFADVYADVSIRYDYETEPADGANNEDTTLTIGIGAEF